jgi:hypothetical protein
VYTGNEMISSKSEGISFVFDETVDWNAPPGCSWEIGIHGEKLPALISFLLPPTPLSSHNHLQSYGSPPTLSYDQIYEYPLDEP